MLISTMMADRERQDYLCSRSLLSDMPEAVVMDRRRYEGLEESVSLMIRLKMRSQKVELSEKIEKPGGRADRVLIFFGLDPTRFASVHINMVDVFSGFIKYALLIYDSVGVRA